MVLRKAHNRLWEIDFLRGIAVIIMIFFHFLYDLNHLSITQYHLYTGFFAYIAYGTASIFILLTGVSLTISYNKIKNHLSSIEIKIKYVKRGSKIFLLGLVISLITYWYIPERFVIFGVLHCIGSSIILSPPFIRLKLLNVFLGFSIIILGIYLHMFTFNFPWLLPFGFVPQIFYTVDYFPLLPWFGVVLLGISVGNLLYKDGKRTFKLKNESHHILVRKMCFLGRNSLLLYFIHQPILFALIYLFLL
jgi:uncharacterized membrane protein